MTVAAGAALARRARPTSSGLSEAALPGFAIGVVCVLAALPFVRLCIEAIAPGLAFNPAAALDALSGRAVVAATIHSLETGIVSAALALAIGCAVALAISTTTVRSKQALAFLLMLSMMVAPQVVALAYAKLAGPSSPLLLALGLAPAPGTPNPAYGRAGIVLVLALHHAPLAMAMLLAGLRTIPQQAIEAAQIDGASPAAITRLVVLPLLRPHLVAAGLLCFVAALGNFGIPALLGLPVNYMTLPTLIYRRLSSAGPAIIADVAALSLLVAAIAGLGIVAAAMALRRGRTMLDADRPMLPYWRLRRPAWIEAPLWGLVAVALVLPMLSLLAAALVPSYGVVLSPATATLDNFVEVLWRQAATAEAFRNSLVFAATAAVLLAGLSTVVAYTLERSLRRWRSVAESVIEIPYALPGVVLAIACILLFLKPLPVLGVSLYGTPFIILFAYLARFLSLALKAPSAAMAQLDIAAEEAAMLDGASRWQALRHVVIPSLLPAATAGGLLVFLVAFNELTVSALLWSRGTMTIGVALFSLEEAGLASAASAVAVSACAVIVVAMLALDRMHRRLPAGVLPWRL